MTPTDAVAEFTAKAERRGLQFLEKSSEAVEVQTADVEGFPVGLSAVEEDMALVTAGYWHDHFENMDDALECCAFLLSVQCRLKLVYRGATLMSCVVQRRDRGHWRNAMRLGYFIGPYWKKKRIQFRQNTLIRLEE